MQALLQGPRNYTEMVCIWQLMSTDFIRHWVYITDTLTPRPWWVLSFLTLHSTTGLWPQTLQQIKTKYWQCECCSNTPLISLPSVPCSATNGPAACMHRLTEPHTPVTCVSCRVQQSSISNRFDATIINYKRKKSILMNHKTAHTYRFSRSACWVTRLL